MTTTAVYAGSLDPVTLAHLSIVYRSTKLFDHVIVGVGVNSVKNPLFTVDERIALTRDAIQQDWDARRPSGFIDPEDVTVEAFDGLLVDFCWRRFATVIVRGLRAVSDFEQETRPGQSYISSSMVKEIARQRSETGWGALGAYCPPNVVEALKAKFP